MKCSVCDKEKSGHLCPYCGFDESCNYDYLDTFAPVAESTKSIPGRLKEKISALEQPEVQPAEAGKPEKTGGITPTAPDGQSSAAGKKKALKYIIPAAAAIIVFVIILNTVILPGRKNNISGKDYNESTSGTQSEEISVSETNAQGEPVENTAAAQGDEEGTQTASSAASDGSSGTNVQNNGNNSAQAGADNKNDSPVSKANANTSTKTTTKAATKATTKTTTKATTKATTKQQSSSSSLKVGDIYRFGRYEQDDNTSNGKETIEWIVLAKESNRALLISKYVLDCKRYDETKTDVTWEISSLRKWVNGSFYNSAFSSSEQSRIRTTTVTADKNPYYDTNPGNNTQDKVFLLSIKELNKYFSSDMAKRCVPTEYAKKQGVHTDSYYKTADGKAAGWWWLRSPGMDSYAASVYRSGYLGSDGAGIHCSEGVRPALWINL